MEQQTIFICGALRSGSSLTHLMLDHHPNITNPGEFDFLFDLISDEGNYPSSDSYSKWLGLHRIFRSKRLNIDTSLSFPEMVESFILQLSKSKHLLALNIHRHFDRIPFLFPNAKFIHLVRDPRDVARSSIGMGWAGNVYYGVDHWLETELSWNRLQAKISPEQCFELRFEDLILAPEVELEKLCLFMGVQYSEKMLDYVQSSTYGKPDVSLIKQWVKKLSEREIQYVEAKSHKLMQDLRYELSGYPLSSLGLVERSWLMISNKLFKLNFFINRYGLHLFIRDRISRLFRLEPLSRQVKELMNEIDKQYLK